MTTQEDKTLDHLVEQKERLAKVAKEQNEALDEELTLKKQLLSVGQSLLGTANDRLEAASNRKKQVLEVQQAEQEAREAEVEHLEKAAEAAARNNNLTEEELRTQQANLAAAREAYEISKKKGVTLKEQLTSLAAQKGVVDSSTKAFDSIATSMGISRSHAGDMAKNMVSSYITAVKTEGIFWGTVKSVASLASAFWDVFSPVSLISSAMSAIWTASWEFLIESSQALSNFSAAAGDAGSMAKDVGAAMSLGTGVNIEQAAQAASGLAASWRGFSGASSAARTSMIRTAAELNVLGISAESTGEAIELLTRTMGVSTKQAEKTLKGMASAASSLGTTPAKLQSDLASVQGSLSLYGDRMIDEFYDLAGAAKAAGLEMSDLTALGESFDSFDDASSKTGNLNALLGGPFLDSMEMMRLQAEEGPDAVAYALKDAFAAAGKSYKDMNYMEKKSYADSIGMSADKFGKLMSMSKSEAKAEAKKAKQEAASQKRYKKMLRSTVSLGMQIKNFFQSVFANKKVVGAIRRLMGILIGPKSQKGLKEITKALGDKMAAAIEVVTIVAERLVKWFSKLTDGWGDVGMMTDENGNLMKDWGTKVEEVMDSMEEAMEGWGTRVEEVMDSIGPSLDRFGKWLEETLEKVGEGESFWDQVWEGMGFTFANFWDSIGQYMVGGYLAIKAIGVLFAWLGDKVMATFAKGFRKSSVGIGKGFITLARAISRSITIIGRAFMSPTGMFFTGSLAIILGTLGYSLKQLAAAFQGFGEMMTGIGKAFDAIGGFITHLIKITTDGLSVRMLKFMYDFSKALDVMGMSMRAIPGVQSNYIVQLIKAFQANGPGAASAMDKFAEAVERLVAALQKLSTSKIYAFGWNMTQAFEATAKVTPQSAKAAAKVIDKAKEYQKEVVKNKDNVDALAELLKATGAAQPAGGPGGETVIRLELGGKVMSEYIWNSVNGDINRRR